jgi:hypothetical protein
MPASKDCMHSMPEFSGSRENARADTAMANAVRPGLSARTIRIEDPKKRVYEEDEEKESVSNWGT